MMKPSLVYFDSDAFVYYIAETFFYTLYDHCTYLRNSDHGNYLHMIKKDDERKYRSKWTDAAWITILKDSKRAFKSVFHFFEAYFTQTFPSIKPLSENDWKAFTTQRVIDQENTPLLQIFLALGPWWAKQNGVPFICTSAAAKFEDTDSFLFVPFFASPDSLQRYIDSLYQIGADSPHEIAEIYVKIYGKDLLTAISRGIYRRIYFFNEDSTRLILSMIQVAGMYTIRLAHTEDNQQAFYINALLQALIIPNCPSIHYDTECKQWFAHC